MHGRLRSEFKRQSYASMVQPETPTPRGALAHASKKHRPALTFHDYQERERKKACQIFLGFGPACARRGCAHPKEKHPKRLEAAWS